MITKFKLFENVNNIIIEEVEYSNLKEFLTKYKISPKLNKNSVVYDTESYKFLKNYKILIAIENKTIIGYFYKYLGGDENSYDDGYVESSVKGVGSKLLSEMKNLGNYTTFCRIGNIPSLKMHLKATPSKIICITDGSPEKNNYGSSNYNKSISNEKVKKVLKSGELYYYNEKDKCPLINNNKINPEVVNFILNNKNISIIYNNKKINPENKISNLKYYFLY